MVWNVLGSVIIGVVMINMEYFFYGFDLIVIVFEVLWKCYSIWIEIFKLFFKFIEFGIGGFVFE